MQIFRAANYRPMPWKNGGGVTSEIAAFPEGADLAGFGWRISMARVAAGGPFSCFPEVDRTLTVLAGDGLWLTLGEQQPLWLDAGSDPLVFPADIPASAVLAGAPVTDLNVMTRRGHFSHRVCKISCDDEAQIDLEAEISMLFCGGGRLEVSTRAENARLAQGDCVLFSVSDTGFRLRGPGQALVIEINAVVRPIP